MNILRKYVEQETVVLYEVYMPFPRVFLPYPLVLQPYFYVDSLYRFYPLQQLVLKLVYFLVFTFVIQQR